MHILRINTKKKQEIIEITSLVKDIVKKAKIDSGICVVYVPHATAAIIVNENYDAALNEDIIKRLEKLVPSNADYRHDRIDNNAHAHIKASILGPSETIIIKDGELRLGRWQGIALCEFDGPR